MTLRAVASSVVGLAAFPFIAHAGVPVAYSTVAGQPTSVVPTGPGLGGAAQFASLTKPFRSADGTRWMFNAGTNLAAAEDRVLVVVTNGVGSTVLREGAQAPWTPNAETMGFFLTSMSVNNSGSFAFGNNTQGGDALFDDYVVKFNGTNYVEVAQQGDPAVAGGGNYGASQDSITITNDGTVAFATSASSGGSRFLAGSTVVAQVGVTAPANQAAGGTQLIEALTTAACFVSADGATTMYRADLAGDTTVDLVIVRNGSVVLREGETPAGMANPISTFNFTSMMSNGDWFVRGETATDLENFVVRNGTVIAKTGDVIATNAGEIFDDAVDLNCFFFMHGNDNGDYVIGGTTDNGDPNVNQVLVLNGQTILAREDDPVDLDNDNVDDDNAYIASFFAESGFLTNDALYASVALRDSTGTAIPNGSAIIRIPLPPTNACPADTNNDGNVNVTDLLAVIGAWGTCAGCAADTNDDGQVNVTDLLAVIGAWGACP